MIVRFLASTAVAGVLFTGAAMAQMSSPPNNTPSAQPAPIQTQNPRPRDSSQSGQVGQAGSGAATSGTSSQTQSTPTDQSATPHRSMTQRAGDSMKHAGQKVKSAFSSNKSSKQTAQGHSKDNIADQLNACETKPQAERQSCIDAATRM